MIKKLTPDYMFDKYSDITPKFLSDIGVSALIVDIDNTLAPYETPTADKDIILWFDNLRANGIKASLISNNNENRVKVFNSPLRLTAFHSAGKPRTTCLLRAMEIMKSDKTNTAVVGDQLFTDCLAGKRLGLRAIIVPPIKDKKTLFFRAKRALEYPIIKKHQKEKEKHNE